MKKYLLCISSYDGTSFHSFESDKSKRELLKEFKDIPLDENGFKSKPFYGHAVVHYWENPEKDKQVEMYKVFIYELEEFWNIHKNNRL